MARARRATSSIVTVGVILIPPFAGPRAVESMTVKPCIPIAEFKVIGKIQYNTL